MPLIALLGIVIVNCLLIYYCYCALNKHQTEKSTQSAVQTKNTVILWDIHGVLFEKSMFQWLYIIITYPHLFSILKKLNKETATILMKYCGKKIGLIKEEATNQELINCAQKVNNHALIDLTMRISCAYKPKYKTIALVKKLHEHGYEQHIGSNIGKAIFEPFALQHPTIFSYFSYRHIIDTQQSSTVIKKPNKEFFLSYLTIHKTNPQHVLFVDDRWANIKAARACGLKTIHFKNSTQLYKDLEHLGLFKKENNLI